MMTSYKRSGDVQSPLVEPMPLVSLPGDTDLTIPVPRERPFKLTRPSVKSRIRRAVTVRVRRPTSVNVPAEPPAMRRRRAVIIMNKYYVLIAALAVYGFVLTFSSAAPTPNARGAGRGPLAQRQQAGAGAAYSSVHPKAGASAAHVDVEVVQGVFVDGPSE